MADDPNAVASATAPAPTPVAPSPPPAAPPPGSIVDDRSARIAAAVILWQVNALGNSPVSRDSEAWAHVTASLPDLVNSILTEV